MRSILGELNGENDVQIAFNIQLSEFFVVSDARARARNFLSLSANEKGSEFNAFYVRYNGFVCLMATPVLIRNWLTMITLFHSRTRNCFIISELTCRVTGHQPEYATHGFFFTVIFPSQVYCLACFFLALHCHSLFTISRSIIALYALAAIHTRAIRWLNLCCCCCHSSNFAVKKSLSWFSCHSTTKKSTPVCFSSF